MAEIQDIDESVGEIEAVEQQQTEQRSEPEVAQLPEKYRGKSVEDVVRMHQEAEKLIGARGREIDEVRKLADELIKSQLVPRQQEEEKPKEIDFFENPQEAIRQQIENNPRLRETEAFAKQMQQQQAKQLLAQKHPDVSSVVADAGFQEWVKASKVRTNLFKQAEEYDLDAADELLSTYKELRGVKQRQVEKVDTAARDSSLKAASVDAGGTGEMTRKVYRRADLIRLKMRDPSKYESMSDEIMAAYAEGRVK